MCFSQTHNLTENSITIDDIAHHVGMNHTSLCIAFKKVTKQTIVGYLTDIRIRVAKYLLKNDNSTIARCCYESGFNDVPYFNRTFKKRLGVSPSQYRSRICDLPSIGRKVYLSSYTEFK